MTCPTCREVAVNTYIVNNIKIDFIQSSACKLDK